MGMFDYLYYEGLQYQTKDTPSQGIDSYKLEKNDHGELYLWVEEYDSEWIKDEGHPFGAYEKQSNHHWVRCDTFDGLINFYRCLDRKCTQLEEFSALLMDGKVIKLTKWEGPEYE